LNHATSTATTTATTVIDRTCRPRYAFAPSSIAPAICFIRSFPAGDAMIVLIK
jgi:hypothetical protein